VVVVDPSRIGEFVQAGKRLGGRFLDPDRPAFTIALREMGFVASPDLQ
jgi:hypothetical protein